MSTNPRGNTQRSTVHLERWAPLTHILDHEWERLRTDAPTLRKVNEWRVVDRQIDDLDELLAAIGRNTSDRRADVRLRALVGLAATEPLAARIVLQRLLPGIIAVAVRRCHVSSIVHRSLDETIADLVAAEWIEIRCFGAHRRPACMAAALLRDAEHRVFRPSRVQRRHQRDLQLSHAMNVECRPPGPLVELATIVREGRLSPSDRELLRELLTAGVNEAATHLGVSVRTLRYRRQRLVDRLRASA